MKTTIEQVSFNAQSMSYHLFFMVAGNEQRIKVSHEEALAVIWAAKKDTERTTVNTSVDPNENITYWLFSAK